MAFSKIRPRGDTKSKWEAANPVLLEREIGVEWENTIGVGEVNIKFGDGVKHWNELDYAVVSDIKKKIISSFAEVTAENPALEEGSTLDLLWAVTKKKFEYLNIQINGIKTMIGAFSNITVESGGVDQAAADITNAIQLLNSGKLSTADIYNGLDSTNALLALSALQGHDLNSKIEKLNGDLPNYYALQGGIAIPSGADLKSDTYRKPGNYYCPTNDIASTLTNSPASNAFILKVERATGNSYPRQIFAEYNTGKIISRVYNQSQGTWFNNVSYVMNSDLAAVVMTKTRTENPHVSETSFNRINAFKIGPNLILVSFNLTIDGAPLEGNRTFVEIGRINGISRVYNSAFFDIPAQNGSGTVLMDFAGAGVMRIYNEISQNPATGWVRTTFVALVDFD